MVAMCRILTLGIVFIWFLASPALAAPPGALDLIPDDAAVAVVIRSMQDLKAKADLLATEVPFPGNGKPSTELDGFISFLRIRAGFDETRPLALVMANPQHIGAKNLNQGDTALNLLVLAVPFSDRVKMAANFGLSADSLKPDQIIKLQGPHILNTLGTSVYLHENYLFLGNQEKAILSVARGKALRNALRADQQRMPQAADILVQAMPGALGNEWSDFLRDLNKEFQKFPEANERQTAEQLVNCLKEVRYLLAGVRLEHGLGLSLTTIFPAANQGAARQFLTALMAGPGASDLVGLPTGRVVAAQAARGDGTQNAVHARVLWHWLCYAWPLAREFLGTLERPTYLGIFTELWQRLRGSRFAVYRNADERRQGLFSVVGILDTDDAAEFATALRSLARLVEPGGVHLVGADARPEDVAAVEKLVTDLGDRRFRARNAASTRLALLGEPALPFLEKALDSPDPETRQRAQMLKQQIVDAAAARRKELLSKDLTRPLRPLFAYIPAAEKRLGQPIDVLRVHLTAKDAAAVTQLQQLFGPDWENIRLATHGKQVVVLLGSNPKLLEETLSNLKEKRPGLVEANWLTVFRRQVDPERKVEFHLSIRTALALQKAEDLKKPEAFGADQPMTSLGVTVGPERLQLDIWLPSAELTVLLKGWGW
jgi:hypothetical protein